MTLLRRFAAALALAAVCASAPAAVIDPLPFVQRDEYDQIKISPKGDYYAVTAPRDDRTLLAILRASDRSVTASIDLGKDYHVTGFWWVNPERVAFTSAKRFGIYNTPFNRGNLNAVNVDGSRAEALAGAWTRSEHIGSNISTKKGGRVSVSLVDTLPADDRYAIVATRPLLTDAVQRAERIDVYTGAIAPVALAPVRNAEFATDNAGTVRFAAGFNADNVWRLFYRADGDGEWSEINDFSKTQRVETAVGFSADDKLAYLRTETPGQPDSLVELDVATMQRRTVLVDDDSDIRRILYRAGTQVPVGVDFDDDGHRFAFLDDGSREAKLHRALAKAFPGQAAQVTSQTTDGKRAIVQVWSDRSPGDHYLFDLDTMQAEHLLTSRPWLDPDTLGTRKPIALAARDGLRLKGYVTLPHGVEAKKLPMVVLPHGGPFGVYDGWSFDAEAQMLAKAGYAVLQINYRGSGNRGIAFENAGRRQWGRAMQDDLVDATRWAIEQGLADRDRICIHGSSYGGYAALMGVARDPGLFHCASGYVGVYDLPMLVRNGARRLGDSSGETFQAEWIGAADELAAVSPTELADRIEVPVLLAAGGRDFRAPIEHTQAMEKALERAGVPVETVYYDGEGHGFFRLDHQQAYYAKLLEFLDRHIGAGAAKAKAP